VGGLEIKLSTAAFKAYFKMALSAFFELPPVLQEAGFIRGNIGFLNHMLCLPPIDAREVISRSKLMKIDLILYLSAKEPN